MRKSWSVAAILALAGIITSAVAQSGGSAESEIRGALDKWTRDFNAGRAREICNIFSPDLRYDYRGYPERGFNEICVLLQRSLGDRSQRYSYELRIKEILVSGDLAVVRLVWTLTRTSTTSGETLTAREPGTDIFRRQPDGSWKIIRYMAYED